MHWNEQISHIHRSLPGLTLWMQCVPLLDDDSATEEGVGLATQRESEPKGRWYDVVFFRVVADAGAPGADGDFLPGRGEEISDRIVEVGYRGEHDALEDAIGETKSLAKDLPMSGIYRTPERLEAILDKVTDRTREGPADGVRLWTVQGEAFWRTLTDRGVLRADGRRLSLGRDFCRQYRWLRERMTERVKDYGGRPPIWCWTEKPDMRGIRRPGGVRVVRAELEIPAERVLVSDFDLWHVPLGNGYLAVDEADDEAFDREARQRTGRRFPRWYEEDFPEDLRERLLGSWERVFPDRWGELKDPELYGTGKEEDRRLQACVEEIRFGDVVGVEQFVTRRGAWENGR